MKSKALFGLVVALLLPFALAGATAVNQGAAGHFIDDGDTGEAALRQAAAPLFDAEAGVGETRALLILRDGRIVVERYGDGFGPDSKMLSWSVAKTVTALLVGIMVGDGRLALDAPVPVAAWSQPGDPRGRITLRQMLNMASGIQHREREGPTEETDALRLLVGDGAADMAAYAEAKPLARPPGSAFQYNSATTLILGDMMTGMLTPSDRPTDRRNAMAEFVRERLAKPAGLASLTPEFDARGTMIAGAFMHMTARDYAQLGELLRHHGRVNGRQIVPERWVDFMTSPSPRNAGYGGQIWLNRAGAENTLWPGRGPRDLFAANGFRGQYVIVSPAQRLTVVRLGVTTDAEMPALRAALARLMEKLST